MVADILISHMISSQSLIRISPRRAFRPLGAIVLRRVNRTCFFARGGGLGLRGSVFALLRRKGGIGEGEGFPENFLRKRIFALIQHMFFLGSFFGSFFFVGVYRFSEGLGGG